MSDGWVEDDEQDPISMSDARKAAGQTTFDMSTDDLDATEPVSVRDLDDRVWTFTTQPAPGELARRMKNNPQMDVAHVIEDCLSSDGVEQLNEWMDVAEPSLVMVRKVMRAIFSAATSEPVSYTHLTLPTTPYV